VLFLQCNSDKQEPAEEKNTGLKNLMEDYYTKRMALFPIEATWNGDTLHNAELYPDFTDSYRAKLKDFYSQTLSSLQKINREGLNENDKISYDFMRSIIRCYWMNWLFHLTVCQQIKCGDYI
jgi:uncharacterized protein (DUF885 family)